MFQGDQRHNNLRFPQNPIEQSVSRRRKYIRSMNCPTNLQAYKDQNDINTGRAGTTCVVCRPGTLYCHAVRNALTRGIAQACREALGNFTFSGVSILFLCKASGIIPPSPLRHLGLIPFRPKQHCSTNGRLINPESFLYFSLHKPSLRI